MPQKHDIGHRKRLNSLKPAPTKLPSTTRLAIDLVKRGLASRNILDNMSNRFTPTKGQEQTDV
jgi:hypothetical protein